MLYVLNIILIQVDVYILIIYLLFCIMYTLSFLLFILIYVYIFSVLAILSSLLEIFFPLCVSTPFVFVCRIFFSFKYLRLSVALLPYFSCQSSSYWLTNMAKVENSASLFNSSISLSHPSSQASFFGYIATWLYTINHGAIILIIQSNPQKQTKLSSCLAFLFSSSCSTAVITTTAITVMPMPVMMMIVIKLYVKSGSLSLST